MVGQLEAAHALCHGPRKRPFLVPEELALEQSRGNGGTIQLHEGVRTPRAQVVNGACNELFARAGLAGDEDGRLGGRHGLHLVQHAAEGGAGPHDVLKGQLTADFLFQIELFLREVVLERGDLAIGERVLDGDRHLTGHLGQKRDLLLVKSLLRPSAQAQHAEAALAADERQEAVGLETLTSQTSVFLRTDLGGVGSVHHYGLTCLEYLAGERALEWSPPIPPRGMRISPWPRADVAAHCPQAGHVQCAAGHLALPFSGQGLTCGVRPQPAPPPAVGRCGGRPARAASRRRGPRPADHRRRRSRTPGSMSLWPPGSSRRSSRMRSTPCLWRCTGSHSWWSHSPARRRRRWPPGRARRSRPKRKTSRP